MRILFKLVVWAIMLSPLALAVVAWFALEDNPRERRAMALSHADIARAQRVIKENDPRKLSAGAERTVQISERDLNLAANYLLQHVGGSVRAEVHQDVARLSGSVRIPKLPLKSYLNFGFSVSDIGGEPRVSDLHVGQVPIPDRIAHLAMREALDRLLRTEQGELASDVIKDMNLSAGRIAITYLWRPDLIGRARDTLTGAGDQEAMATYYNALAALHAGGKARRGSLLGALQPLFRLAQHRSQSGADPVSENRSLLLVLGAWAIGRGMDRLVPQGVRQGDVKGFRLSLERRGDFGQHFLVSAALAAGGDSALSAAVGLFKEVRDSQSGSGFSFADLAADRAGTRFGEVATNTTLSARRVQKLLATGVKETGIMPRARDLPEHLSTAEFQRRYGEIGSPAYNNLADEIERRVSACSLYRGEG